MKLTKLESHVSRCLMGLKIWRKKSQFTFTMHFELYAPFQIFFPEIGFGISLSIPYLMQVGKCVSDDKTMEYLKS